MRIVVMGAGGLGGYYAALLARAGHSVGLVARGEHLRALLERGLKLLSPLGDVEVQLEASDDPSSLAPAELVLFTVKRYDTDEAAHKIKPLVEEGALVLTLQNGIDAHTLIAKIVGGGRVLPGASYVFAFMEGPGVIRHAGGPGRIVLGEPSGGRSDRCERLAEAFRKAGIPCDVSDDILAELWSKFVWICGAGALASLSRLPLQEVLALEEGREFLRRIMEEVVKVGRASGVALKEGIIDEIMDFALSLQGSLLPSITRDLLLGRRLEVDAFYGKVISLGRELGVPTPLCQAVYASLKPHDLRARARAKAKRSS